MRLLGLAAIYQRPNTSKPAPAHKIYPYLSRAERRTMVERVNPALAISQQCRLLAVSRSSVYRKPAEVAAEDLAIMARIDRQYLARPY
jgi:hypothetical protein